MSLIMELPGILEAGRKEYEEMKAGTYCRTEELGDCRNGWKNIIACADNGPFMKNLIEKEDMAGKIQMVYIDPPFFTKANHEAVIHVNRPGEEKGTLSAKHLAYDDHWSRGIGQYLSMLASRLYLIRDLLTDQGTVWVHLDWHAVHYVRLLMDEIFGADHFVNEIVWTYKSGGASKKHFARKHDTILVYSKSKKYYFQPLKEKSYNRGYKPYHFKGVEEFQDELGWYTMVNMKDVWQIDMVGRTSHERTGYATQKPEAILERIMESCTREGDICADFFCGSGTLAAAAQRMNRRWICCDQGKLAVSTTYRRAADMDDVNGQGYCILAEDCGTGNLSAELKDGMITLRECDIQPDYSVLEGKDLPELKAAAEENPLLLIDSWSVDWDFDGEIHRPNIINFRKKGKLDLSVQLPEDKDIKCCSIAAYDMLGGRYQTVIEL